MLNFNSVMIGTADPKKLGEFYEKVIGRPADMFDGFYSWKIGDSWLGIGPHSEVTGMSKEPQRIILNMETTEVQEEFDRIKEASGATVVKEPYEMQGAWIATFADPDGNYFQLMSPWEPDSAKQTQ